MSWLDDLGGLVSGVGDFLNSNSVASNLAKSALMGFTLNKVNNSVNRQNQTPDQTRTPEVDPGVRLQVQPNPNTRIPVVYGTAQLSGIITDAALADSNRTLWLCFTLSEKTGTILSNTLASVFSFGYIYINDQRVVFKANGYTIDYTVDRDGNVDRSLVDLVDIHCYRGSSSAANNVAPLGYSISSPATAYSRFPNWTSTDNMTDLIFVIAKFTYSKEKNLNTVPTVRVQLSNTMDMPGDVIYDYMTNTRYGAGIPSAEIYSA